MPWRICLLGVIAATLAGSAHADSRWWATTAFGTDGIAQVSTVDAIAAAPDGTIVLAGGGQRTVDLDRYSADGKRIGFGRRRKSRGLATGVDYCRPGLAIRSNGTILVACGDIVAALKPNGTLRSLTAIPGANFDSVSLDDLGRPVAAGDVLVRLNTDGGIDPSFARTTLPTHASSVLVDGGRVLLVMGGSIHGYEDDGTLDTTFGTGGVASFPGFAATSVGTYSHWIVAGGSHGDQAAVVRFFAGGAVDTRFGSEGIAAWGPEPYMQSEEVVGLGVRRDGAIDTAVVGTGLAEIYYSYETTEDWLVQRVTPVGTLGDPAGGPENYIDPTAECVQEFPVALAEQPDGKVLVSGIACADAVDYTTYSLLERYDSSLAPDFGVTLRANVSGVQTDKAAVSVRVALNGPCRLIARIQRLDGNDPIGPWLSKTVLDVAHGPALLRLRLAWDELRPHVRYAVVVSAYDARGYYTNARALLKRS